MPFNKIAEAYVEIEADKGKYTATIRGAKRETAQFARAATKGIKSVKTSIDRTAKSTASMAKSFGSLKRVVAGLGLAAIFLGAALAVRKLARAVVSAGKEVVLTAVKYDRLKIGLKAVAGSAGEAERQLIRLEQVAKLPGLSFEGAIAGSTALQAAGMSAQLAERSLLAFGNALVTVGKGAHDLQGVNLALTQIITKGSGFGQELRQLSERLPQVRKAMKDAFGIGSVEDFKKLGLSAEEFIEGIVVEFEKLPSVMGTISNDLENLGIAFDRLKAEIGKTMLDVTRDTAKGLTGIMDDIRAIIPVWQFYRSEIIDIMGGAAKIIIVQSGVMMKAVGSIIRAAAPLLFLPIMKEGNKAFVGLAHDAERQIHKLMFALGKISGETLEKNLADSAERMKAKLGEVADTFEKDYEVAIDNVVDELVEQVPVMSGAILDMITEIGAKTKVVADEARKLASFKAALMDMFLSIRDMFRKAPDKPEVDLSGPMSKELQASLKLIGESNAKRDALYIKDTENARLAGEERVAFEMTQQQEIADFLEAVRVGRLAREKAFFEEQKRQVQELVDTVKPAFEDMFSGLISGETKGLWAAFWQDLRRIAIRELAGIFATQVVAGLFTGGTGVGVTPIVAGIQALAGGSAPRSPAGGAFRNAGTGRASFSIGTMVVNDQDLTNFDIQRMSKQVEQGIGPALARAAADGI